LSHPRTWTASGTDRDAGSGTRCQASGVRRRRVVARIWAALASGPQRTTANRPRTLPKCGRPWPPTGPTALPWSASRCLRMQN